MSVAEVAILYDAPSMKAKKLFIVTPFMPVEQIVALDSWTKVRDASGKLYWMEKRLLSKQRYVLVTRNLALIRTAPQESAPVVFKAGQQLALEWLENNSGWVKVRHQDGATGYVKSTEVWGE